MANHLFKKSKIYDFIKRRRSLENFIQSNEESYLKHTSGLAEPYRSLSPTWQQVYLQMTRFLPDDELMMTNSADGYFQKALDKSLLHARCFVADISIRITIALIYYHSNPAC